MQGATQANNGGTAGRIALLVLRILVAALFVYAGGSKLAGAARQIALFDAIGWGQWFRYATGAIEVAAGVLLVVPATAALGALGVFGVSIGALLALVYIGRPPTPGLVAVAVTGLLVVLLRARIAALLPR